MPKGSNSKVTRQVTVRVNIPRVPAANGLNQTVRLLDALEARIQRVTGKLAGLPATLAKMSSGELLGKIREAQSRGGSLSASKLGEALKLEARQVQDALDKLRQNKDRVRQFLSRGDEFRSAPKAAEFFESLVERQRREGLTRLRALTAGGKTTVSPGELAADARAGGGKIQLEVGGNMVKASVVGVVKLEVPASQISASVTGGAVGASGGTAGAGGRRASGPSALRTQIREALAAERQSLGVTRARLGGLNTPEAADALAAAARKSAANLSQLLKENQAGLEGPRFNALRGTVQNRIKTLEAQADRAQERAAGLRLRQAEAGAASEVRYGEALAGAQARRQRDLSQQDALEAKRRQAVRSGQEVALRATQAEAEIQRLRSLGLTEKVERTTRTARSGQTVETTRSSFSGQAGGQAISAVVTREVSGGRVLSASLRESTRAIKDQNEAAKGLIPTIAGNTAKVALWATSVGILYGSLNLAGAALRSMTETGLQTARLGQVFRGNGGSARELADDVLKLAAIEGRSREEALDSAIAWSRLGLTRQQVNETVRASLVGASIAEIDAATATDRLQSIMAAYNLTVSQVTGTVNTMNVVTNTTKVRMAELFDGLTRSASAARAAGVPLEQLIGIIGATVQQTGQTGANIGNAIKTIVTNVSRPEVQNFLRNRLKLDVNTDSEGNIKSFSDVLHELAVRYEQMDAVQRRQLVTMVGGATQANRLTGIFDAYGKSLDATVRSQSDLNSAERESAAIRATLGSRAGGVLTEAQRALATFDSATGFTKELAESLEDLRLGIGIVSDLGNQFTAAAKKSEPFVESIEYAKVRLRDPLHLDPLLEKAGLRGAIRNTLNQSPTAVTDRIIKNTDRELRTVENEAKATEFTLRRLDHVRRTINFQTGKQRAETLKALSENKNLSEGARAALASGSAGGLDELLAGEQSRLLEQRKTFAPRLKAATDEAQTRLQNVINALPEGEPRARAEGALDSVKSQMETVTSLYRDIAESGADQVSAALRTLGYLEAQRSVLQSIAGIYETIRPATEGGRVALEVAALREQEVALERAGRQLQRDPSIKSPVQREKIQQEIDNQLSGVRSRLLGLTSAEAQSATLRRDRAQIAAEFARAEGDSESLGFTRLDEIRNRESGLNRLIAQKTQLLRLATDEISRGNLAIQIEQHKADLAETQLSRIREAAQARKEEFEYQRRLLTGGPQALLQRVLASNLLNRGIGPGQFFTLGSNLQQAVIEEGESRQRREFLRTFPSLRQFQDQVLGRPVAEGRRPGVAFQPAPRGDLLETSKAAAELAGLRARSSEASSALGAFREDLALTAQALLAFREDVAVSAAGKNPNTGPPYLADVHGTPA